MKDLSRRAFFKRSALATAGSMLVPQFLKAWENPAPESDKILIVLLQRLPAEMTD